jgi:hypothetical protein
MKNPFLDFQTVSHKKQEIPLNRIVRARQEAMHRILGGYLSLVEAEAKDFVWRVEQSRVLKTYDAAVKRIQGIHYDQDDIEEFCGELDSSPKIPYLIEGPAGIYVSALINQSREDRIFLRLKDFQKSFHLLGYRLASGKTLVIQGDVGDFIGASLTGGRLVVEGSTGNWCGAGMLQGEIRVLGSAGWKTGEWMKSGEIHVAGWIRNVGKNIFGGRIYERGELVFPRPSGSQL